MIICFLIRRLQEIRGSRLQVGEEAVGGLVGVIRMRLCLWSVGAIIWSMGICRSMRRYGLGIGFWKDFPRC